MRVPSRLRRQMTVGPDAGLQTQSRGSHEGTPQVHPWDSRAPWVQREDDVIGLPSGKSGRI